MATYSLRNPKYQNCIDACNGCMEACEVCASACLKIDDGRMMERCIRLCHDCSDCCVLASQYMSRDSEFVKQICNNPLITICEECARECDKHAGHMDECKKAADACRICADECRKVGAEGR